METYIHPLNKRKALLEIFLEDEKQQDCQAVHSEMLPLPTSGQYVQREAIPSTALMRADDAFDNFSWYEE
jgi:hypothetical protein